ncbi:MAG TPA: transposase [Bacteroidota bacterium]|nr:transposase [Bacteroidota bacterium]
MMRFEEKYHVDSKRLKGYDYSLPGKYFVTICTKSRVNFFGVVEHKTMRLSQAGKIAGACWMEIPEHHDHVVLDEFIVMPNHVHGILVLISECSRSDVACNVTATVGGSFMSAISPKQGSLGSIVRSYKSAVANQCHRIGLDDFQWQPRYHDHIIRDHNELSRIRAYIRNNPGKWSSRNPEPISIEM